MTFTTADRELLQRRTVRTLFGSTIAARGSASLAFTVASIAISDMLDGQTFAGVGGLAITIGSALSAGVLSSYMASRGRNPGLRLGYAIAASGGLITAFGIHAFSLWVFLIGLVAFGVGQGTTNLSRYAAADLAPESDKASAIGNVVFASTIGAVAGPQLFSPAKAAAEAAGINPNSGPFIVGAAAFAVAGLIIWLLLRPDPLVVSGGLIQRSTGSEADHSLSLGQALGTAWSNPPARLALLALVISQAVMVMVMTMTPLHMDGHGHSDYVIGSIISVHTAGMFAFAPIAGRASRHFGRVPTIAIGGGILALSTVVTALAVDAPSILMFPGLFLLGLGWSFGIVAGSALLTESIADQDRVRVQGSVDALTAIVSGVGAFSSGLIVEMSGFHVLSIMGTVAAAALLSLSFYRHKLLTAA